MTPKQWALSHVGDGYIYGARGQKCSLAFREQQAKQYPAQADMILGTGAKWDGHQVWDCAQFTRFAWKQAGVELVSGATSQWKKTDWQKNGQIADVPNEVCSVFRMKDGKMQHTGLYIGDGIVIHAKGTLNGVIRDTLTTYPWTHYGLPKVAQNAKQGVSDMDVQYKAVVTCSTGSTVRLRKEASQNSKIVYPVPKGSQVDVLEDGAEWSKVQYGSYTGYMMSQFLTPAEVEELAKDTEGAEKESSGLYLYEAVADLQKRVGELERLINEIRAEG